jgi:hypothetical protein
MTEKKPIVERKLFLLDTNITGTYKNTEGEVVVIDNMIHVVSGTDGTQWFPANDKNIDFSITELSDVEEVDKVISDKGLGLLYDENGTRYAVKGDLVFRDGSGTVQNLTSLINQVRSISENADFSLNFKDSSLDKLLDTKNGIMIDQIIKNTRIKSVPFSVGNISQIIRNVGTKQKTVSVVTVPLTNDGYIWVVGKACVTGSSTIRLVDKTANVILDTSYVDMDRYTGVVPCFLSYVGVLPQELVNDVGKCDTAVYNSFFKRFFKSVGQVEGLLVHEIAIEIDGDERQMEYATIDMTTFDTGEVENVVSGEEIVSDAEEVSISFENELPNDTYAVSLKTETFVQKWYTVKTTTGFTVSFERPYTGSLTWTVVYSEI